MPPTRRPRRRSDAIPVLPRKRFDRRLASPHEHPDTVHALGADPADARRELARRHLHVFGPATADRFARWAGIQRRAAADAFAALGSSLLPVRSRLGDEWLLADDEPAMRTEPAAAAPPRLLPSGDAYFLLAEGERELLVPRSD